MKAKWFFLGATTLTFSLSALAQNRDIDFGSRPPSEVYRIIKTALNDSQMQERKMRKLDTKRRSVPSSYDVATCWRFYAPERVIQFGPQDAAITAASYALGHEKDLTDFGIPEHVWQRQIANFDNIGVAAIASSGNWISGKWADEAKSYFDVKTKLSKAQKDLYNELVKYRSASKGKPSFKYGGECGAGEEESEIIGNSSMLTLMYIPYFNYRVCQLLDIDPENQSKCVGWTVKRVTGKTVQISSDDSGYLIGAYRYVAKLPGGTSKRGEFLGDAPRDSYKQVVRIDLQ